MEAEYQTLCAGWLAGDRDRERALNLLFLTWWHWAEPEFLTGLSDDPAVVKIWREVFDHFGGETSMDAEFLFVAGIEVSVTPWAFGDEDDWARAGERMMARSQTLRPGELLVKVFEGRGEYGKYFAHQARIPRP